MGFWEEVQGEQPPRTCGSCMHCARHESGRAYSFDPFQWVPDGDSRREDHGICEQPGEQPVEVLLSAGSNWMPCGGEGYERRYA